MASAVKTMEHTGRFGQSGFDILAHYTDKFPDGGTVYIAQGGLGDSSGQSVRELAEPIIDVSDGEAMVAVVGTKRPKGFGRAIMGLANARKHQSQSGKGAVDFLNDTFHPGHVVIKGQSRGGVSATDTADYLTTHPKKNSLSPDISVITIDTPGVFGPLEHEGSVIDGLIRLGWHCLEDFKDLHPLKQAVFLARAARRISAVEIPYFIADVAYLNKINLQPKIQNLREVHEVPIHHIFHRGDLVPGAEVDSEFSYSLEGGHARFMVEPYPVAETVVSITRAVQMRRQAA